MENYSARALEAHWERLECLYLASPHNEYYDPGVRISSGEAEIVIPVHEKLSGVTGTAHSSVYFTAMADSAALAVNSIVENTLVVAVHFDIHLSRPIATGQLIARSRFLGMSGDHYLAESVLTDSEGEEIGKGNGAFTKSDIPLSSESGDA